MLWENNLPPCIAGIYLFGAANSGFYPNSPNKINGTKDNGAKKFYCSSLLTN